MKKTTAVSALFIFGAALAVPLHAQSSLTNGLVAYYPFNGNANDASGNGMDGVVHGATLTADRFGTTNSAYHFDGVSSYIETTNMLPDMTSATVSCWINPATLPLPYLYIMMDGDLTPGDDFAMNLGVYTNLHFATKGNVIVGETIPPVTNTWYQVVAVMDGNAGVFKFWLNGQLMTNLSFTGDVNVGYHSLLDIGCRAVFHDYIFNGALDDLRIYNRALSDFDVQTLYQVESTPPSSLTNGLVAFYPFNGNANDASSNGMDGVVHGATLTLDRFGISNSAYQFDGVSSYIATTKMLPDMTSATASYWIKPAVLLANYSYVFSDGDFTPGRHFDSQLLNETNGLFQTKDFVTLEGGLSIGTNTWYQVVVVADNSSSNLMKIWLNGQLVGTTNSLGNADVGYHSLLSIGCRSEWHDYIFNGAIDDLRIYNRALSDSEVQALYQYESQGPPVTLPGITSQPQSVTVNAHSNATFTVTAGGTAPLYYQWSLNDTNLPGATSNVLSLTNVTPTNLGPYAVFVSNAAGSITSSNAVLSMYPFLAGPFSGLDTDWGYTNTLGVTAWGSGPLSFQWYQDGAAISGATNSTLTLAGIQFTNAGLYSIVVSSPFGSVTNTPQQVVVNPSGVSFGMYPGITLTGVVGFIYNIQATTNLGDPNSWTTVATVTLTAPTELWVDVNANAKLPSNPLRYYRVVPGP